MAVTSLYLSDATPAVTVTAWDRLTSTLLYALALHLALIMGLDFDLRLVSEGSLEPDLEITLVHPAPVKEPDQADFLAQVSREGGGQSEERLLPTTRVAMDSNTQESGTGNQIVDRAATTAADPVPRQELSSTAPASREAPRSVDVPDDSAQEQVTAQQLLRSSREIARLSAQLAEQTQQYAKRPRKAFVSASTREYKYAAYMESWRAKVERIGNMNYPQAARQRGVSGSLRLAVELRPDGSVSKLVLRRSSGQPVLDKAALDIVRLAAPFAPFPEAIRKETDILVITRTWVFDPGHGLTSR